MTARRSGKTSRPLRAKLVAFGAALLLVAAASAAAAQQSFKTGEAAAESLVAAAKAGDRKAMLHILGPGASDIVSSGDAVADAATRARFIAAYDAKHQLSTDGDSKATLVVGDDDFPFPIPLVRKGQVWQFDAAEGRREILYRRIGRNELDAIQASLAYVDAQNEYADEDRTGAGKGIYAQRIVSRPGTKDGLYWPDTSGKDESPLGEFVARASAEGYRAGAGRTPFHGYYYKILTQQGPAAAGGAEDYIVKGRMIGGFALVAYPAIYRNSGVMTFIVNHAGTVFQKDLGPNTAALAEKMQSFNPDPSWTKVSETPPQQ